MTISAAAPVTTAPIGTDVVTGSPISVPLRCAGRPVPLSITGASGTGKSTLAAHITDYLTQHGWHAARIDKTLPTRDLREFLEEFTEQNGPKVMLLDEAEARFQHDPQLCALAARTAHQHDLTILAVTYSLTIAAFGGSDQLRSALTFGSTIQLWTNATERAFGTHLNLSQLDRRGHGYLDTPTAFGPREFRTG